jgi:hypothetical protein
MLSLPAYNISYKLAVHTSLRKLRIALFLKVHQIVPETKENIKKEFVEAGRVHNLGNLYPWGGPVTAMELSDRVIQAVTSGYTTAPLNRLE